MHAAADLNYLQGWTAPVQGLHRFLENNGLARSSFCFAYKGWTARVVQVSTDCVG